jgi:hypothetical protein
MIEPAQPHAWRHDECHHGFTLSQPTLASSEPAGVSFVQAVGCGSPRDGLADPEVQVSGERFGVGREQPVQDTRVVERPEQQRRTSEVTECAEIVAIARQQRCWADRQVIRPA